MKIDRYRANYIRELERSTDVKVMLELLKEMVGEEQEKARNLTNSLRLGDLLRAIDKTIAKAEGRDE